MKVNDNTKTSCIANINEIAHSLLVAMSQFSCSDDYEIAQLNNYVETTNESRRGTWHWARMKVIPCYCADDCDIKCMMKNENNKSTQRIVVVLLLAVQTG